MNNQVVESKNLSGHSSSFLVWVVSDIKKAVRPFAANVPQRLSQFGVARDSGCICFHGRAICSPFGHQQLSF